MHHSIDDSDLEDIEEQTLRAIDARSLDRLNVLGFGEMAIALSWDSPTDPLVIKRVASADNDADADSIAHAVSAYIDALDVHVRVAPTDVRKVRSEQGRTAVYLIQPRYDASCLVENVLPDETPRSDHPLVTSLRDAILGVTSDGRTGIDAQFSNFAWIDDELVLFDVGTPFMFDADGNYVVESRLVVRVMPAPLRPVVAKRFNQIIAAMGSRQGAFEQAAASLVRMGEEQWLDAVLETFQPHVSPPLDGAAVREKAESLHSDSQGLKRLMRVERFWSTKVRRRPFDVFITDSFTGELL